MYMGSDGAVLDHRTRGRRATPGRSSRHPECLPALGTREALDVEAVAFSRCPQRGSIGDAVSFQMQKTGR
jgi:hypothetical protein